MLNSMKKFVVRYMSPKGRAGRLEFWLITLIAGAIIFAPAYIFFKPYSNHADMYINISFYVVAWPSMAVQVRRWHDRNKSANWVAINVVPLIGVIWTIVELGFLAGIDADNPY